MLMVNIVIYMRWEVLMERQMENRFSQLSEPIENDTLSHPIPPHWTKTQSHPPDNYFSGWYLVPSQMKDVCENPSVVKWQKCIFRIWFQNITVNEHLVAMLKVYFKTKTLALIQMQYICFFNMLFVENVLKYGYGTPAVLLIFIYI